MKKILAFIAVLALAFTLVACEPENDGGDGNPPSSPGSNNPTELPQYPVGGEWD